MDSRRIADYRDRRIFCIYGVSNMTNPMKVVLRHVISIIITAGFLACSIFIFPHSLGRIIEGGRDFGLSIAYYFCEVFEIEHGLEATVNTLPVFPFFEFLKDYPSPIVPFPESFELFKGKWVLYWELFATKDNVLDYLAIVGNVALNLSKIIVMLLPFVMIIVLINGRSKDEINNDYGKDSKALKIAKWYYVKSILPIKNAVKNYLTFLKENGAYWKLWLFIWAYNFNFITIALEFFAYYFYFVSSFDLSTVYRQVYKLIIDLWPMIVFLPTVAWIGLTLWLLSYLGRKNGYAVLEHREKCNRGFINERGVVTIVYGAMGAGKTAMITDISLSAEVELRDQALEIILESDLKFPSFPWIILENDLKGAILGHEIYDVWSCRRYVAKKRMRFCKNPSCEKIYGYDYQTYGITYDDSLKVVDVWSVIEDYACAYLIYAVQSSLIVSNYSIRVDSLMADFGNFPLWDSDFFKRDSRLIDSFSRHSHILDFDMLRLGKTMIENNPNRNAYGFGVYVVSEIDKERKNTPELKGVERDSDECNQKNDLFNIMLKMSRHAVVVANRVFVKVIGDLQRPTSLGGDARELGEVIFIDGKSGMHPVLPFYSPYWLFELVYTLLKRKFDENYLDYRFRRGDNTLGMTLFKSTFSIFQHHYERTCNVFGSETLNVLVESGRLEGAPLTRKYYRQSKKIWANRYATDCLSGIYEVRGAINRVGIDDLREYADLMATNDELQSQNSHFQKEISSLLKKT